MGEEHPADLDEQVQPVLIGPTSEDAIVGADDSGATSGNSLGPLEATQATPAPVEGTPLESVPVDGEPVAVDGSGGVAPATRIAGEPVLLPIPYAGIPDHMQIWAQAISRIESGSFAGNYLAQGPVITNTGSSYYGDRAYGRFQIMGRNLPGWSQAALGRTVTIEQFLGSPHIQDAIFAHRFGGYVARYGNARDAASAWHSGRPLSEAAARGATDGYTRTTVYVASFTAYVEELGGSLVPGLDLSTEPLSEDQLTRFPVPSILTDDQFLLHRYFNEDLIALKEAYNNAITQRDSAVSTLAEYGRTPDSGNVLGRSGPGFAINSALSDHRSAQRVIDSFEDDWVEEMQSIADEYMDFAETINQNHHDGAEYAQRIHEAERRMDDIYAKIKSIQAYRDYLVEGENLELLPPIPEYLNDLGTQIVDPWRDLQDYLPEGYAPPPGQSDIAYNYSDFFQAVQSARAAGLRESAIVHPSPFMRRYFTSDFQESDALDIEEDRLASEWENVKDSLPSEFRSYLQLQGGYKVITWGEFWSEVLVNTAIWLAVDIAITAALTLTTGGGGVVYATARFSVASAALARRLATTMVSRATLTGVLYTLMEEFSAETQTKVDDVFVLGLGLLTQRGLVRFTDGSSFLGASRRALANCCTGARR